MTWNTQTHAKVPVVRRALVDKVAVFPCAFFGRTSVLANHSSWISDRWSVMFMSNRDWLYFRCNERNRVLLKKTLHHSNGNTWQKQWHLDNYIMLYIHAAVNIQGMTYPLCRSRLQSLCIYRWLCPYQLLFHNYTPKSSDWLTFLSCSNRCAVHCSVTNKESKSFPPTQQGDFQPHVALKSDSKHKTQRLGKDKGFPLFFQSSFPLCERVQVHCLCGQHKFTFHHKATPAYLTRYTKVWIFTSGIVCVLI